jgi:NAD(P)H-nitrite reductase large subunit
VHGALRASVLAAPGATTIVDVTSCPGTDTCKLGISSSRGLGAELRNRLAAKSASLPEAVKSLKIKISGLLQQLRSAPHRRHRLLRQQPQDRRPHGARTSR